MGAGQSQERTQTFLSHTDTLDVWLHQENFRYSLHPIQRGYEWKPEQVIGLLETVAKVTEIEGDRAIVKLGEVILLDRTPEQDGLRSLTSDWHRGSHRYVDVIDGQQRITTLVLIAAVCQHKLRELVDVMADGEQKEQARMAVLELQDRFSFRDRGGRGVLLSRDGGNGGLVELKFDFAARDSSTSEMDLGLADREPGQHEAPTAPLKAVVTGIYKWLNERLEQEAPANQAKCQATAAAAAADAAAANAAVAAADAAFQDVEAAAAAVRQAMEEAASKAAARLSCLAEQAAWLLGFLEAFRCRVLWTTSLTASRKLAVHAFCDANLGSYSVPLKESDVIKVALVSGINNECLRHAVDKWGEFVKELEACAGYVKELAQRRPYLQPLGDGSALPVEQGDVNEAIIRDCLCHVRAIEKASSADDPASLCTSLAQHFAQQPEDIHYIRHTLLPYGRAYCAMLADQVPEAQSSLLALLSLPAASEEEGITWRHAAVAIIREIKFCEGPIQGDVQGLLAGALKQLECVALWLATVDKSPPNSTRTTLYRRIIQAVTNARANAEQLKEVLNNGALCSLAFDTIAELSPASSGPAGMDGRIRLIRQLYMKGVYQQKGRVAKAMLLGLEVDGMGGGTGGLQVVNWNGEVELEHLLPQTISGRAVYWQGLFGTHGGAIHRTFMDLLGNLSLVTSKLNKQMSNKPFPEKLRKMEEQQRRYRTLETVFNVRDRGGDWDMHAVLERHEWLLSRLAQRYGITVTPGDWTSWRHTLLGQLREHLHPGARLQPLLHEPSGADGTAGASSSSSSGPASAGAAGSNASTPAAAQAAAAAAPGSAGVPQQVAADVPPPAAPRAADVPSPAAAPAAEAAGQARGAAAAAAAAAPASRRAASAAASQASAPAAARAVSLTAGDRDYPGDIQVILASASAGVLLHDLDAAALLYRAWDLPLTTKLPNRPPVGSLFLIDEDKDKRFRKKDGYDWDKGGDLKATGTEAGEEVVCRRFSRKTDLSMRLYIWRMRQTDPAAGESQSEPSGALQACLKYRLVQYVRYTGVDPRQQSTPAQQAAPGAGTAQEQHAYSAAAAAAVPQPVTPEPAAAATGSNVGPRAAPPATVAVGSTAVLPQVAASPALPHTPDAPPPVAAVASAASTINASPAAAAQPAAEAPGREPATALAGSPEHRYFSIFKARSARHG